MNINADSAGRNGSRRRFLPVVSALLGAMLIATACGNRHDLDAAPAASPVAERSPSAADAGGASKALPDAPEAGAETTMPTAGEVGGTGAVAGAPPSASASGALAPSARTGAAASGQRAAAGGAASARTAQPGAKQPAAGAPAPAAAGGCPAPCAPIVIGHVGSYAGVFSGFANGPKAVEAWAQLMNERGGIDGHRIRVIVAEDGGDPARHLALVRQLVEEQGAMAFVGCFCPATGQAAVEYLNKKRVPVVGGSVTSLWYYKSPMHFPQVAQGDAYVRIFAGSTAEIAVPQGKTKLAVLACSEVQVCKDEAQGVPGHAKEFGMHVVYSGQASLAQPDYTAECLAARNAGAEVMALAFDPNSFPRIARSCSSVGYRPLFSLVSDVTNGTPQIEAMDGALIGNPVRSWTDLAHPGVAEMTRAAKAYAPKGLESIDNSFAIEWVSAKLFERAARGRLSATPTAEDLLKGLWSIKGDDLGGLTYPLTFTEGQEDPQMACWSIVMISQKKFTSPRPDVKCR
jgi:branched-chain amino acid transport system substrate-binding protein